MSSQVKYDVANRVQF